MNKKLYRSESDKAICGVCAGFARYFGVDPIIVRLIFVLSFLTYGVGLMFYLACAIVIPKEPEGAIADVQSWPESSWKAEEDADRPATRYEGSGEEYRSEYYTAESGSSESKGHIFSDPKSGRTRENVGVILMIIGGYLVIRFLLPWLSNKFLLGLLAIAAGVYVMKTGKK